jgi:hypothetical protein
MAKSKVLLNENLLFNIFEFICFDEDIMLNISYIPKTEMIYKLLYKKFKNYLTNKLNIINNYKTNHNGKLIRFGYIESNWDYFNDDDEIVSYIDNENPIYYRGYQIIININKFSYNYMIDTDEKTLIYQTSNKFRINTNIRDPERLLFDKADLDYALNKPNTNDYIYYFSDIAFDRYIDYDICDAMVWKNETVIDEGLTETYVENGVIDKSIHIGNYRYYRDYNYMQNVINYETDDADT